MVARGGGNLVAAAAKPNLGPSSGGISMAAATTSPPPGLVAFSSRPSTKSSFATKRRQHSAAHFGKQFWGSSSAGGGGGALLVEDEEGNLSISEQVTMTKEPQEIAPPIPSEDVGRLAGLRRSIQARERDVERANSTATQLQLQVSELSAALKESEIRRRKVEASVAANASSAQSSDPLWATVREREDDKQKVLSSTVTKLKSRLADAERTVQAEVETRASLVHKMASRDAETLGLHRQIQALKTVTVGHTVRLKVGERSGVCATVQARARGGGGGGG